MASDKELEILVGRVTTDKSVHELPGLNFPLTPSLSVFVVFFPFVLRDFFSFFCVSLVALCYKGKQEERTRINDRKRKASIVTGGRAVIAHCVY